MTGAVARGFMVAPGLHFIGHGVRFRTLVLYASIIGAAEYGTFSIAFASTGLSGQALLCAVTLQEVA